MSQGDDRWRHFDVDEADPGESRLRRWLPAGGAVAIVVVLGGVVAWMVSNMGGTSPPQPPPVQQVSLVLPPPPPPPPPRIEEPEPELEELELEQPEPDLVPLADDSAAGDAPGDDLGLDADGVAGSDDFGLVARRGGRSLLGGGGDRHAWYASIVQRDLQTVLANDAKMRSLGEYAIVVSIWLTEDGRVSRSELQGASGNPQLAAAIDSALGNGVRLSREPPDDLPQPIRLRITSRS